MDTGVLDLHQADGCASGIPLPDHGCNELVCAVRILPVRALPLSGTIKALRTLVGTFPFSWKLVMAYRII